MDIFTRIQQENKEWASKNFSDRKVHHPLLGMIEELGELYEALHPETGRDVNLDEVYDAIGDVLIYMADFCNMKEWVLQELFRQSITAKNSYSIATLMKRMAHHQLKGEQNIRGGTAHHEHALRITLMETLARLRSLSPILLEHVGANTWDKVVAKRNWKADPKNGGESK